MRADRAAAKKPLRGSLGGIFIVWIILTDVGIEYLICNAST